MELGRPSEAARYFEKARDLDAGDWQAPYLLGLAEARAGHPEEAVEAYRTALARNERLAEAHNNLAWLLADLDLDPVLAEVHARRAAELQPENANVLGTLGWAQYKNRLLPEASATLERATELSPSDPMKRYMLGVVLFHEGRRDQARREVRRALELDPDFARASNARDLLRRLDG
jgi:Flp pilus assembly protein TadD